MYIKKIKIHNFRNFDDFTMEFHKGLNVIVGANNSGKTGLLYAIRLLREPNISVHDFNKNDLLKFDEKYKEEAPYIHIEFTISHEISESDAEDESIVKLISFLGMKEISDARDENGGGDVYNIVARVSMTYKLDPKVLSDYKKAVAGVTDFESFLNLLDLFSGNYSWTYTNGISDTDVDKKEATAIFDIQFISAERTKEDVIKETKREIDKFSKEQGNAALIQELNRTISAEMKGLLKPALDKLTGLFENENNEIGLAKGGVAISQNIRSNISVSDAYVTDVKDTESGCVLPLEYNGLGYNNLINIYMLIKLSEIRKGKDFRILCLEEPEAHLHPSMQYKLFKYLRCLDEKDELNQQIFVTTHSSNISAVAGIDNMFMLAYDRSGGEAKCKEQSLAAHFEGKETAKRHLTKFLDVTRSDMLFADKVVLVEGIAEKLLLPKFMEKLGLAYEDEHISIIEIGGKHFEHFIELFNGNNVIKKVLCLTDNDFSWSNSVKLSNYTAHVPGHIEKLRAAFPIDNLRIETQTEGGRTFEEELFFANVTNADNAKSLLKIALSDSLHEFITTNGNDFEKWNSNRGNIDGRSKDKVENILDFYIALAAKDSTNKDFYERLFFANLFLCYAQDKKGDVALNILIDDELISHLEIPSYIKEGLKWLLR